MNHESNSLMPTIIPQYTDKNYIESSPMETTYFDDKLKPMARSTFMTIER